MKGENEAMTNEQKMLIASLREEGLGYKRIADRVGISVNTVKSFCKRNDGKPAAMPKSDTSVCRNCGKKIMQTQGKKRRKFCSDECRRKWWNSHLDLVDRRAVYEYTCPGCGKKFSVYGDANRKYCSHECYVAHRYGGHDGEE